MKQATILLLCACALVPALAAGIPALAQTSQAGTETTSTTTGGIGPAVFPQAGRGRGHALAKKLDRRVARPPCGAARKEPRRCALDG